MLNIGLLSFLALGAAIYGGYAWLTFNPALKTSSYLIPGGLALAVVGNLIWIFLAKNTTDPHKLTIYGMAWDTMVTVSFLAVPVLFFGVRFTGISIAGLILAIIGIVMMKLGSP